MWDNGRKFRKIRTTALFKCGTYFMNHDITMNAFLPNPQLSSISNLWKWWCFFQNTMRLMSYIILFTQETGWRAAYKLDFCIKNHISNAPGNLALRTKHSSEYFVKWIIKPLPLALSLFLCMRLNSWFGYA